MNKKVIITGVSGQDGSYMVDYLLKNTNYDIYGMVRRLSVPNHFNLKEALKNPRFQLVTGDLSDPQSIDKIVGKIKPDYFINLAAQSFVYASWELPEQTIDVNATGVMRCLEAIVRHCPNCRFYNAGSSEEFGDVQYSPQDEKHPLRARSPYGCSKISARQIVKTYRESFNLYAVQGYLFNHESPRRGIEFVTRKITDGVAKIYHAIKNNKEFNPIELGNLDSKRDWSHSKDFIDGIWRMLNQEKFNPNFPVGNLMLPGASQNRLVKNIKEYVLSSNETHTIRELIEKSFSYAGITGSWIGEKENEQFIITSDSLGKHDVPLSMVLVKVNPKFYRPADVELLLGDSNLARKELDWCPKYDFNSLVSEMVKSDIENS